MRIIVIIETKQDMDIAEVAEVLRTALNERGWGFCARIDTIRYIAVGEDAEQ